MSKKNSEEWLISYSDLFLLVLAFFVFRHPLLEEPIKTQKYRLDDLSWLSNVESKNTISPNQESINYDIHSSWFIDNDSLSWKGEENLRKLAKQISSSTRKLSFKIDGGSQSIKNNEVEAKRIQILAEKLKNESLEEITIEYSVSLNANEISSPSISILLSH